jgi:hypothetical protein
VPPAKVLLLGTFHFAGSATDEHATGPAGMLSERRQREIAEVVAKLTAFRPTIIAIEATPDRGEAINGEYQRYLNDDFELTENEIHQIGFRLAQAAGLERVEAIDAKGRWLEPYGDPAEFAKEHGQSTLEIDPFDAGMEAAGAELDALQASQPLREHLLVLNDPRILAASHSIYLRRKLAIGDETAYPATDGFVSQWYNRNLRIYSNLLRVTGDEPGRDERIVVIIGAGHVPILRHLFESSLRFDLVEAAEALGDSGRE